MNDFADMAAGDVKLSGHLRLEARKLPQKADTIALAARDRDSVGLELGQRHAVNITSNAYHLSRENYVLVKEAIRKLRDGLGLTQEQFARQLGISVDAVRKWERGSNRPYPAMLEKLAGLCSGDLAEFFRRESGLTPNESLRPRSYNMLIRAANILLEASEAGNAAAAHYLEHYADELAKRATEVGTLRPPEGKPAERHTEKKEAKIMKAKRILALMGLLLLAPPGVYAHGGGLDSLGCHNDRKAGNYHCHRGALAGRTFKNRAEAEKALGEQRRQPPPPQASSQPGTK